MFQTEVAEKIKRHLFCLAFFFSFENHVVYEIVWINTVEPYRPQITIWRVSCTCWIPKTTNTHSEYVILIAFPLQQSLYERSSMLCYTHVDCLVNPWFHTSMIFPTSLFLYTTNLNTDNCAFLGHYTASSGNSQPTFRNNRSVAS